MAPSGSARYLFLAILPRSKRDLNLSIFSDLDDARVYGRSSEFGYSRKNLVGSPVRFGGHRGVDCDPSQGG